MGVVENSVFEKELERLTNSKTKIIELPKEKHKGRNINDVNVPQSLRKIIGETNELDSRTEALSIAKDFGISPSSVSAYAHGNTSTASYHKPNNDLDKHIEKKKRAVQLRARSVLMNTLAELKNRDLSDPSLKITELASVAKNMSGIMKDVEPSVTIQGGNNTQILVYKPRMSNEEDYQIINVNE